MFKNTIRFVKRLLGIYESDCEYWVDLKDIKVNPEWRKTKIGQRKFGRKLLNFLLTQCT